MSTHPCFRHRKVAYYFRQLIHHGFWVPIIWPVYSINGVRDENPLVSRASIKKGRSTSSCNYLTFGTLLSARLITDPGICSQQGLTANPPIHPTAPIPWFARTHGTMKHVKICPTGMKTNSLVLLAPQARNLSSYGVISDIEAPECTNTPRFAQWEPSHS